MRTLTASLTVFSAAILLARPAAAELGESTVCRACATISHVRACHGAAGADRLIRGRVTTVLKGKCSLFIAFAPANASRQGLPPRIDVDLGPCAVWAGPVKSSTSIAVIATPAFNDTLYSLACRR